MIKLPRFLAGCAFEATLEVCRKIREVEEDEVIIDATPLCFVDPFGLTMMGEGFQELIEYNQLPVITGLSENLAGYLHRMDLFRGVELRSCAPRETRRHDRRGSLMELTLINSVDEASAAAPRLAMALVGRVHEENSAPATGEDERSPNQQFAYLIGYVLGELLENALTHAQRRGHKGAKVWVAGQYYPTKDLVRLAVTDTGCGFLESLFEHPELVQKTHHAAILAAMKPRVSCNRDVGIREDSINQGVGLTTTIRIAEKAGGNGLLISGDGYHSTKGRSGSFQKGVTRQGVAVSLEIPRMGLCGVNLRELLPPMEGGHPVTLRFE